jgi:D-alanyl-lipoteichoic acid acyltransferase DltB (MBOAT superfamily)
MLFNSPEFIFGFLPLTLCGFFLSARLGARVALAWLTLASLVFYAWWKPAWLALMLASMVFNFFVGRTLALSPLDGSFRRRALIGAITLNLAVLVYFKYAGFLVENVAWVTGSTVHWTAGELPLGISFFTFTQLAFLVDVYQRKAVDLDPLRYGLFVTYFPHLIAGPVLHHEQVMPQFARPDILRPSAERLAEGGVVFVLGLFKKVVLADAFGGYANPAFGAAAHEPVSFFASWGAALSYTLQLYFDFSGYCDMAIGLGLMIGVQLPLNFHSPYKAQNISEFWRRWHMTLSRFLRDYLYIPLGGNRVGPQRRSINLMATMLLGGLWHGAGWTFVVWGGLHGLYLMLHQAWLRARGRWPGRALGPPAGAAWGMLGWLLTFLAVVVGWVIFRAPNMAAAYEMLRGMSGLSGSLLPDQIIQFVPWLSRLAKGVGKVPFLADGTVMGGVEMFLMIGLGLLLVTSTPALHELRWRTRCLLVVPCGALAFQRVLYGHASEFLYFQF